MNPIAETDIAAAVVRWLEQDAWDVYQEVQVIDNGGVCDLVAVRGPLTWCIEVKKSLGFAVFDQAMDWRPYSNLTSVAVLGADNRGKRGMISLRALCQATGIGVIEVNKWLDLNVSEPFDAQLRRVPRDRHSHWAKMRATLTPEHKAWGARAGNARGDRFTPYRWTCSRLLALVRANPGITLQDACKDQPFHYSTTASARSALRGWIDRGKVPGVEMRREGRRLHLYPVGGITENILIERRP
jgi:hypothetical protein